MVCWLPAYCILLYYTLHLSKCCYLYWNSKNQIADTVDDGPDQGYLARSHGAADSIHHQGRYVLHLLLFVAVFHFIFVRTLNAYLI